MKKYLLSIAVLLMATIAFTACSNDDEPVGDNGLAKTAFTAHVTDDGDEMDVTVSFVDDKTGIQYVNGVLHDEDGMKMPTEMWINFTYTMEGSKVVVNPTKSTIKFAGMIEVETFDDYDPTEFIYDKANKTLTVVDEDMPTVLKQTKYKEIVVPTK